MSGKSAKLKREIDGGQEIVSAEFPLIIGGQKGLVEESELRPTINMSPLAFACSRIKTCPG